MSLQKGQDHATVLTPYLQWAVRGSPNEVFIGRQQCQLVTDAELCEQGVDGADLQTGATATIAQFRGVDVILSVRSK